MRRLSLVLISLLLAACSSHGNSWGEASFGQSGAQKLRDEASSSRLMSAAENYAKRPWVLMQAELDDPDITQIKSISFHSANSEFPDVGSSEPEVKTIVVLQDNYKFLQNSDKVSERAVRDGYVLRVIDRETNQVCSVKLDDNSPSSIKDALTALPSEPSKKPSSERLPRR